MKLRYFSLMVALGIFSTMLPLDSYANLPVIDVTEIAQTLAVFEQIGTEIEQVKNVQNTVQGQYTFLKQNLNGNYGYGYLYNTPNDLNQRQWSNDSWMDVMNMVYTDKDSAFYQAQKNYAQRYQILDPNQFNSLPGVSALTKNYYQDNSQITRAALATSSFSYNDINQHMQTISSILQELEAQPSEKAAIDLNTRLVAELGFIQLEMLKAQNIQTQLTASNSQGAVNGMSDQARFMQWNPN